MYIKKLKQKMNAEEVEKFIAKHRKFRLMTNTEMIENDVKPKIHTKEYSPTNGEKLSVYLVYTDEYLFDLDNCKDLIERMPEHDRHVFKKFFNSYVYK